MVLNEWNVNTIGWTNKYTCELWTANCNHSTFIIAIALNYIYPFLLTWSSIQPVLEWSCNYYYYYYFDEHHHLIETSYAFIALLKKDSISLESKDKNEQKSLFFQSMSTTWNDILFLLVIINSHCVAFSRYCCPTTLQIPWIQLKIKYTFDVVTFYVSRIKVGV